MSSAPTYNPVPTAAHHLADLFAAIGSLGAFLLNARFVGPLLAPPPTPDEREHILDAADRVADESRLIDLAIYQLQAAKETNTEWLRTHVPHHQSLRDKANKSNGWT